MSKTNGKDSRSGEPGKEFLLDGKYSIKDLVDLERIKRVFEDFSAATGFTIGFVSYPDQEILAGTGWRDFCVKFHRGYPEAAEICRQSNISLSAQISETKKISIQPCEHGLVDCATPVIIKGKYLAYLATGQVFISPPDVEFYKKRAEKYGFDTDAYLEAMKEIPIVTEEQLKKVMAFLGGIAVMIAEQGLYKLRMKHNYETLEKEISERKKADREIRHKSALLNSLLDSIPDLVFFKDQNGVYLGGNPSFELFAGKTRDGIVGHTDFELFEKDVADFFRENDRLMLEQKKPRRNDEWVTYPDGREVLLDTLKTPYWGPDGELIGVLGISRDITDRKRAEEALEKRMIALTRPLNDPGEIRFEELFNIKDIQHLQDQFAEAMGVASIITHTDGTPITEPSNFCRLCIDIIRKTEKGLMNCYRSDAVLGKKNPDGPKIQPCLSGGLWDAGAGISVGGKHVANWLIGQVRDETQTDEKMRVYAVEIGADEEEVIKAFHEVPAMSRMKFRMVSQVLYTLANQLSDIAYQNVQQARFISEKKEAETEKEKLQQQLLQSQKMEAIGHLAGGVAHDFNNMLGIIMGAAQLAKAELSPDSDEYKEQEVIIDTAKRAKYLTAQLLTFARREKPDVKPANINSLVSDISLMLKRSVPKIIRIETILDQEISSVSIDDNQVRQALLNICNNAADSMPGGGTLTIETKEMVAADKSNGFGGLGGGHRSCCIRITDTGTGIPDNLIDKIFDPFFTTKGIGKGTGLGLSVTHGIIRSNNGTIDVESEPGKGTTVTICLPFAEERVVDRSSIEAKENPAGSERILIVDDEIHILKTTGKLLSRLGYDVQTAIGGKEAIDIFRENYEDIDIVVLDFIMPEVDVRDVFAALREIKPDVSIIIASGYSEEGGVSELLRAGAKGFVQKPFGVTELCAAIREVMDGTG